MGLSVFMAMSITISTIARVIVDGCRSAASVPRKLAWHFAVKRCMTREAERLRVTLDSSDSTTPEACVVKAT